MNILRFFGIGGAKPEEPGTKIEREALSIYERLAATAERFGYPVRRTSVSPGATPCALFLGNHSSGKSTLVNHLLGGARVQDTGVAPTDDGFTVLMFGEKEEDLVGESALARLPAEFAGLSTFGPNLVLRIRLKVRNREILRRTMLVDSPGMIDTVGAATERDYDFFGAVGFLANLSDLVLLMFDPDKPGTTGESVAALGGPLSGMSYKLRILMNKCDLFESMYDYARAYGALCWNLAHTLPVKDLPKVYACYVPVAERKPKLDLSDFDRLRVELEGQLSDAGSSHRDNVVAATRRDVSCLAAHVRMASRFRREMNRTVSRSALASFAVGALAFAFPAVFFRACFAEGGFPAALAGLVTVASCALALWISAIVSSRFVRMRAKGLADGIDTLFEDEYREELKLREDGELRQDWERVRGPLADVLRLKWWKIPSSGKRALKKVAEALSSLADAAKEPVRAAVSAVAVLLAAACAADVPDMDVEDTGEYLIVERGRATAIFNKDSKGLERLNLKGFEIFDAPRGGLLAGPGFACLPSPACAETDAVRCGGFRAITLGRNSVHVETAADGGIAAEESYYFNADGSVTLVARGDVPDMDRAVRAKAEEAWSRSLYGPSYLGSRCLAMIHEPEYGIEMRILERYAIRKDDGPCHQFTDKARRGVAVTVPSLESVGKSLFAPLGGSRLSVITFEPPKR